jgi:hypothetical protein
MLEARVRVTDHALVDSFCSVVLLFFYSSDSGEEG